MTGDAGTRELVHKCRTTPIHADGTPSLQAPRTTSGHTPHAKVRAAHLYEHGWIRPDDDPARARVQQPWHCAYVEAARLRVGLARVVAPRDLIGLWIPWVMLLFYATPIPGVGFTFPGMIAGGGNWLMSFFLSDIVTAVQTELGNLVLTQTTALSDAWSGTSWFELYSAIGDVMSTLVIGTSMMLFIFLCLVVIYAVTYAQVIWAQMAILILTFVGPMMIPWLVFEPMAFLFWGWFRSMITFALYGAIAGAIMRVFMSVSLGFLTTFISTADVDDPVQMVSWVLILLPLMVAGVIASLKVGELAGMLVSGGGGGGARMTGALMTAATGGKAMLAGKAAGAAGVK